jgi:hypothetical protein
VRELYIIWVLLLLCSACWQRGKKMDIYRFLLSHPPFSQVNGDYALDILFLDIFGVIIFFVVVGSVDEYFVVSNLLDRIEKRMLSTNRKRFKRDIQKGKY